MYYEKNYRRFGWRSAGMTAMSCVFWKTKYNAIMSLEKDESTKEHQEFCAVHCTKHQNLIHLYNGPHKTDLETDLSR